MIRKLKLSLLFPLVCIISLLFLGWKAQPWEFSAKLFPLSLVGVGVVLLSFHVARERGVEVFLSLSDTGKRAINGHRNRVGGRPLCHTREKP